MRPRDEITGALMPPPHKRVNMAPFQKAALWALANDPRSPALPVGRKLSMIDKAVDHVIDGDKPPKWVYGSDPDRPTEHFLADLWRVAVRECERVKRTAAHV